VNALRGLKMSYPKPSLKSGQQLRRVRKLLAKQ
jgi:hypothetical protein